jgi:hypothetical protein
LKEIGYLIGPLTVWDGSGRCPSYPKGVVLVVRGEEETDTLMLDEDPSDLVSSPVTHHYYQETAGSLLFNMFGSLADTLPQTYDSYFLSTRKYLLSHLSISWSWDDKPCRKSARATPKFRPDRCNPSSMAQTLAAMYFPHFAEQLGPC